MVDFIHIGFPKTASTWLQNIAFNIHEIALLGYVEHKAFKKVIVDIAHLDDFHFDEEEIRKQLRALWEPTKFLGKKVGISRESLSGHITGLNSKNIADRLYSLFPRAKIIIVIREQFDMIDSLYSQMVKKGYGLSKYQFLHDKTIPIEAVLTHLQYHFLVDYYAEKFGRDKVLVLLFEELVICTQRFLSKLFRFLSVTPPSGKELNSARKNVSLSNHAIKIMRIANYLGFNSVKTRHFCEKNILLNKFLSSKSKSSKELNVICNVFFSQSNLMLTEKYEIPLKDYGYSL